MTRRVKPLVVNTHPEGHSKQPPTPQELERPEVTKQWSAVELSSRRPWLRLSALVDGAGDPISLTPRLPQLGEIIELPEVEDA